MEIAAILTCYNRKEKTLTCLQRLFDSADVYNADKEEENIISISVFMTDDACTDGTADAVRKQFADKQITIVLGDGSCYWAGGMRLAWRKAIDSSKENQYAFYLLLNDDTEMMDNAFSELFACHRYALQQYGIPGIYSGITCQHGNPEKVTYSGDVFISSAKTKQVRLGPSSTPQMVDTTNANILMVAPQVVDSIGIFYEGYIHGSADYDYCMQVRKNGFPALITANVCGECEYDHLADGEVARRLSEMTLAERIKYVSVPTHSDYDYLLYVKRNIPYKYFISLMLRKLRLYLPKVYIWICKKRGLTEY